MRTAAIYCRISQDRTGTAVGVGRQLEACRQRAANDALEVVAELSDNDLSAFGGRKRPGYEQLLELVAAAQVSAVLVWQSSRLWRSRVERAHALDLFAAHGVDLLCVSGPDLPLGSAAGRMLAAVLGEFDTTESAVKSERVAAAHAAARAVGRRTAAVPFGWVRVDGRDELDPVAAPVVAETVQALLAGVSARSLAADLNARGIRSSKGAQWIAQTVVTMAARPANAGLYEHRGQVIGVGDWPAIVSEEDHAALRAMLADPSRRTRVGSTRRRWLLSVGVAECGSCGASLHVSAAGGYPAYRCHVRGCCARRVDLLDEYVGGVVCQWLDDPRWRSRLVSETRVDLVPLERAVTELTERLEQLGNAVAAGTLTVPAYTNAVTPLEERLRVARTNLMMATASAARPLPPVGVSDRWPKMLVTEQRAILEAVGVRVVLKPAGRGARFHPDQVEVTVR